MTQEQKDILLKDLCGRLPYGVMCDIGLKYPLQLQRIFVDRLDGILLDFYEDGNNYQVYLSEVKPYLFPLSSMTEEQKEEYKDLLENKYSFDANGNIFTLQDFYYKYHFDYRGLIPMGLAIDATNLNIYKL